MRPHIIELKLVRVYQVKKCGEYAYNRQAMYHEGSSAYIPPAFIFGIAGVIYV
jgi:hypothetical protein